MAAFGWSVGDIIQGIKVVTAVCRTFSSTKGAEAHFADTVAFLRSLHGTLEAIEQHITDADGNLDGKYSAHIMGILETIEPPLKNFAQFVESYTPDLGVNSRKLSIKKARKKVEWGIEHLDKLSGKTAELKEAIASPMSLVVPLLLLQTIDDIRSYSTPKIPQPHSNYGPSSIIHVFHQSDVAHRLQLAITDLQGLTKKHEQSLKSLTSPRMTLPMAPQPGNQSLWNGQQTHSQPSNEDKRMVIAIDMLRQELKQATEAILKILEESRVTSRDSKSVKNELELYRRTFGGLHQSLESPWSTVGVDHSPAETTRKSSDVSSQTRNSDQSNVQTGPSSGNFGSLGLAAVGSFVGSTMAAATSMLLSSGQASSNNTCYGRSGSSGQFSSDFASLIYACQRSTSTPATGNEKSNTENLVKKSEKSTQKSSRPQSSEPSTHRSQEVSSGPETRNTANDSPMRIKKSSTEPAPIRTLGSAFSNLFNRTVPETSQPPPFQTPASDHWVFVPSRNGTTKGAPDSPETGPFPTNRPDLIDPGNSTAPFPHPENFTTPGGGFYNHSTESRTRSPKFYCCCRCGHLSLIAIMPDERCYMCEHNIDENCVQMDAPPHMGRG